MPNRNRRVTRQAALFCTFCGQSAVQLMDHTPPTKWEREGAATLKDNCAVTRSWKWCATLKIIDPPDDEGEAP